MLPTSAVVSVWPKPSRMVMPQALRTCSITSGLSGSPAATHSRSAGVRRGQVGLDEHAPHRRRRAERGHPAAAQYVEQRRGREALVFRTRMVAPAFHGANTLLQACLAQPGEERFRCTSPGCMPIQYMVDRCPTG